VKEYRLYAGYSYTLQRGGRRLPKLSIIMGRSLLSPNRCMVPWDCTTISIPLSISNRTVRVPDAGGAWRRRGDDGGGRGLGLQHCNRAAVEQKFQSRYRRTDLTKCRNHEQTSKPLQNAHPPQVNVRTMAISRSQSEHILIKPQMACAPCKVNVS